MSAVQSQPDLFPPTAGDSLPDALERSALDDDTPGSATLNVTRGSCTTPSLIKDYVNRLTNHQSADDQSPIFQVKSHKKNFEESISIQNGSSNSIHFTHLCILDSSGNVMVGQLNMNLAHDGSKLRAADCRHSVAVHIHPTHICFIQGKQRGQTATLPCNCYSRIFKDWICPTTMST